MGERHKMELIMQEAIEEREEEENYKWRLLDMDFIVTIRSRPASVS